MDELKVRRFLESYEALCVQYGLMVGGEACDDVLNVRLWTLAGGADRKKESVDAMFAMLRFRAAEGSEDAAGEFDE